jgi:hypothetical protein
MSLSRKLRDIEYEYEREVVPWEVVPIIATKTNILKKYIIL